MAQETLLKTALIVMSDVVPPSVRTAIIPGRSYGDIEPILDYVAVLYRRGELDQIILPGVDGQTFNGVEKYKANAGMSAWARHLDMLQVDVNGAVSFSGVGYNTKAETDAQLQFLSDYRGLAWVKEAREKGVRLIAHPQQLARGMLGVVKQMNQTGDLLKVYPNYPVQTDWEAVIRGPQGAEAKPRSSNVQDEFKRIVPYQDKGDLASYGELLDYYRWRDGGSLKPLQQRIREMKGDPQFVKDWEVVSGQIQNLPIPGRK